MSQNFNEKSLKTAKNFEDFKTILSSVNSEGLADSGNLVTSRILAPSKETVTPVGSMTSDVLVHSEKLKDFENSRSFESEVIQPIETVKKAGHAMCEGSTICSEALTIDKANGVYLWDSSGKRYFDMFSQTWSMPLGHNNKKVIAAVRKQLLEITHLRTAYATPEKTELVQKILELAPTGLAKVNFVLHGSLAVEGAMKLAINYYKDRDKILYLEDGFHGRSFATMGVSWKLPQSKYKNYFTNGIEVKKDIFDIEEKMVKEKPAGIILELIQGNSGCKILDKNLVKGIRNLCDKHGVAMIIDEVQTGFGCMGVTFLCSEYEIIPDILVFGKAIGGGFPLAGTIYKEKYAFEPGDHSFTFAHNPVSISAGLAYLKELAPALGRTEELSYLIKISLENLEKKYPNLKNARCMGLKGAIDIVNNFGAEDAKTADLIVSKMLQRGIIISNSRYRHLGNTLMFQPPLITTTKQLQQAFTTLDLVLNEIYNPKNLGDLTKEVLEIFAQVNPKHNQKSMDSDKEITGHDKKVLL
ncbi:MAG: aspartate aminotransferase family protein [Candidatus Diapherotrites archaeon]|nr:aspartate aminotransferase family protein [Candidatus Diapherotrites archaeon]